MIVTCPGCNANFRVRDESVPDEGAKMQCPKCKTLFLAMAPQETGEFKTRRDANPSIPDAMSGLYDRRGERIDDRPLPERPIRPSKPSMPAFTPSAASTPLDQVAGFLHEATAPRSRGIEPPPNADLEERDPFEHLLVTTNDDGRRPELPSAATVTPDVRPATSSQPPVPSSKGQPIASLLKPPPATTESGLEVADTAPPTPVAPDGDPPASTTKPPLMSPAARDAASFAFLAVSAMVFALGTVFAAWAVGVPGLDEVLMPVAETRFSVRPPRSSVGRDAPSAELLEREVEAAEQRGDFVQAVATLRRLERLQGQSPELTERLEGALKSLGAEP